LPQQAHPYSMGCGAHFRSLEWGAACGFYFDNRVVCGLTTGHKIVTLKTVEYSSRSLNGWSTCCRTDAAATRRRPQSRRRCRIGPTLTGSTGPLTVEQGAVKTGVKRLLLLGQEPVTIAVLGRLLGRGFSLHVSATTQECLTEISTGPQPDGLVLDIAHSGRDVSSFLDLLIQQQYDFPVFMFTGSDGASVYPVAERLGSQRVFRKPLDTWSLAEAVHEALGSQRQGPGGRETGAVSRVVGRAIAFIKTNVSEINNASDVSEHVNVSREHLSRLFTKYVGCTLWDFVTLYRIEKAKALLGESWLSVKEISREAGYGCESTFFRAFVKHTGLTPRRYRTLRRTDASGRTAGL
jgi:AraC-like DNA-binding protein